MNEYQITADSTCDLSEDLLAKYDVELMSLKVMLGEKEHTDRVDIDTHDIFAYYDETKQLPKTAARNQSDYQDMFKKHVKEGAKILHFSISAELSASHQSAVLAATELNKNEKCVFVIDTRALSSGSSLLIAKAHLLLQSGMKIEKVAEEIEKIKSKVQTSFCVDTLEYLHKGGRCSGIALLGANMLGIHPYIKMESGKLVMHKKYRGSMQRVLKKYIETLKEEENPDGTICFVTHSHCDSEIVSEVISQIKETFNFKEIYEQIAGCTITSHCGKGTLGVLFLNE